jgi:hypothetical protein
MIEPYRLISKYRCKYRSRPESKVLLDKAILQEDFSKGGRK